MSPISRLVSLGLSALRETVGTPWFQRSAEKVFPTTNVREIQWSRKILNQLRDQINLAYGFRWGRPRVNLGPCGHFAKAFHEQWNVFFEEKGRIAFILSADGQRCHHVVVRLPGGAYYDGGRGVVSCRDLLFRRPQGTYVDEMLDFDLNVLDKWSYGLDRDYPACRNYCREKTAALIKTYLAILRKGRVNP